MSICTYSISLSLQQAFDMSAAVVKVLFANEECIFYADQTDVIKELAVVDLSSFASQQWRFSSPTKESASYEVSSIIDYESFDGDVPYTNLQRILRKATETYKMIFTYGEKDHSFLRKLLQRSTIFDLQAMHQVELKDLPPALGTECLYHSHLDASLTCPHGIAYRLAVWCVDNSKHINLMKSKPRLETFKNWSLESVDKVALADAGFFHLPCEFFPNLTECIYCGLQIYTWKDDDNPIMKHRAYSKYCSILNFSTLTGFDF
jgi:hypothetical protein